VLSAAATLTEVQPGEQGINRRRPTSSVAHNSNRQHPASPALVNPRPRVRGGLPAPQCRACCKPEGNANDPAPLLPLCDARTSICLVSEPPARSTHSHPPIEWLFALSGQKTEKSIWRDATDAVALARQPLPAVPASARPKSPWPRQCQPCRLEAAPAEVHSPGQETAMGQREVQLDKPALFSTD
jgi:hypothetical protein